MNNDLNLIKQNENSLKVFLLAEFGTYLPEDKISLLNANNYAKEEYLNKDLSDDQIRGSLARTMLRDLINVECSKTLTVSEGKQIELPYGQSLQEALIEYYAKNLSEKYGFNINEFPELADDIEMIKLLNEKLNNSLDSQVFNSDAIKLIKAANFKELLEKEDKAAIKKHLENNQTLAGDDLSKDKELEIISEYFERKNSIQVVWINKKKHLKYIDSEGKVHLSNIDGNKEVNEFIKQQIANLKPNEKLNPGKFYARIKELAGEIYMQETKDVKEDELNYQEVDMLEFIKSNKEIQKKAKDAPITHNKPMNTHVIEETDDIVFTESKSDHIETKVIKNGNAEMTDTVKQDESYITSRILSEDEFQSLTDRFAKGDNLTKEELEALRRTYNYYKDHDMEVPTPKKGGTVLSPYNNKNPGYANNNMVTYLVMLTAVLSIVLIALLYTILK